MHYFNTFFTENILIKKRIQNKMSQNGVKFKNDNNSLSFYINIKFQLIIPISVFFYLSFSYTYLLKPS